MKAARALCLLLLSAPIRAQSPTPNPASGPTPQSSTQTATPASDAPVTTLKVSTRVVEISAVVKAKSGEPRAGLTRDDFILKQDGKEEPIHYFSQGSELPLTLALLVDTSASQRTFIGDETRASDVFFETMLGRPEDRAMLVQFDDHVLELRGLTSSAATLHLSLLGLSAKASTTPGTLLNDAVYATSREILAKETGRKAIVLLTDGGENGSRKTLAEAIEQAERNDVQVYSIRYSMADLLGGAVTGSPHAPDPGIEILKKLSESTGGHVFTVSRTLGLREIFAEIAQDLRLEYELGYTPPPDVQPNSYHKLEVKVKDKGTTVQARKGFFAPP